MSRQEAKNFAKLLQKMDPAAGQVTVYVTIFELLGPAIKDIDGVGFTHLHIDHTQGIKIFVMLEARVRCYCKQPVSRICITSIQHKAPTWCLTHV